MTWFVIVIDCFIFLIMMSSDWSKIDFRVITDLSQAEYYRKLLSPEETIYDLRDLRYCFFKYFVEYQIHFIVWFRDEVAIGLLPLHLNLAPLKYEDYCSSDVPYYEFFGSGRFQLNRILHKWHILSLEDKKQFYNQVIENSDYPYCLHNIWEQDCIDVLAMENNVSDYYCEIDSVTDYHHFIQTHFFWSHKHNIKKQIEKLEHITRCQEINTNIDNQLQILFDYNIERFQESSFLNIPSTFLWPHRADIFRDIIHLKCFDEVILYSLKDQDNQNTIAAVWLSIGYKDIFYYLNFGIDRSYSNIAKFLTMKLMSIAKDKWYHIFDLMSGMPGCRKQERHFDKKPLYILSNTIHHD